MKIHVPWIELTSLGGRRMVVRPEEIVFMAEHPAGPEHPAWTDVLLRNGDKGDCQETIEQIMQQMHPTVKVE